MTDALIEPPDPATLGRTARFVSTAALLLGAAVLVATTAIDVALPAPVPTLIGEEARIMNQARRSRKVWDGSAMAWAEKEARLRSRVRSTVAPYWSAALLRYGHAAPSDLVVGKNGWLFLRDRVFTPTEERQAGIERGAFASAAIARRMTALGTEITVIPVHRKGVLCPGQLPSGMDADAAYEAELLETMRRLGVRTIDLSQLTEGLDDQNVYLPLDSHWAPGLEQALVDRIAEAHPELVVENSPIHLARGEKDANAGLLLFAAIQPRSSLARWLQPRTVESWRLEPQPARMRLRKGATDVDVAMVGSSFTADFQLAELLAGRLGQVVWDGGAAGTAFGESLSRFVTGFHGKALPKTVLYEFPVHQTFGLAQDFASTNGSLGGFFATASGLATQPLPARMGVELTVPPPPGRKQHVPRGFFAPGMLLSSGDGVLQLVASFHSPKPTSWSVRSQDHTLDFTVGAGPQRIVVPVLQPNQAGQLVALVGIDPAAVEVDVAITLELDADLASAAPVALAREGATWRSAALERDVPHDQLAVFEWSEGRASSVTVSIQGRTAEGAPLVIERTFAQPRARVAVLGIGGLAGGSVDGATIAFDANTTIESATLVLTERFAP